MTTNNEQLASLESKKNEINHKLSKKNNFLTYGILLAVGGVCLVIFFSGNENKEFVGLLLLAIGIVLLFMSGKSKLKNELENIQATIQSLNKD